ncbi:helix-turn-helix domain-containing protein [Aquibacillus kalidii]|uniref:helix-turn-helix domain-containing protein n=1 Tax=Aquibacillus kalidii TaxID=2762597 RepID=UPI001644E6DA|nr:AraC family transcriptional regulator [Aquibacillus kalidii]
MNQIQLSSSSLPLVRELGCMVDEKGELKHPNRLMEDINVFIYVKKGIISVIEKDQIYVIKEKTYLFLRNNIPHSGYEFYEPGTEWYYIHFYDTSDAKSSKEEYSPFQQATIILDQVYNSSVTMPKQGKLSQPDYVELQLNKLLQIYVSSSAVRPLQLSAMTYSLFIELYNDHVNVNQNNKQHHIIKQMIELLKRNPRYKLSGAEISEIIGMNYTYLSHLFKEQTGKNVSQFQNDLLIEEAIRLFKEKGWNVTEVSNYLGFSNPFYFSRVFKKVTGIPPSVYLNQSYLL